MTKRSKASKAKSAVEGRRETSAGGLIWRRSPQGRVEVVLVRPAGRSYWVLPKGHVEKGESLEQAAQREAQEETGLTVGDAKPLGAVSYIYSFHQDPGSPLVRVFKDVHFFLMSHEGGDTSGHDAEIDEAAWFDLEEAKRRASFENERRLIEKAAQMLSASAA
jgi:8-oxo-dGTP pyrophosphatase MutT (NUDIX family)